METQKKTICLESTRSISSNNNKLIPCYYRLSLLLLLSSSVMLIKLSSPDIPIRNWIYANIVSHTKAESNQRLERNRQQRNRIGEMGKKQCGLFVCTAHNAMLIFSHSNATALKQCNASAATIAAWTECVLLSDMCARMKIHWLCSRSIKNTKISHYEEGKWLTPEEQDTVQPRLLYSEYVLYVFFSCIIV